MDVIQPQPLEERVLYHTRRSVRGLLVRLCEGLWQGMVTGGLLAVLVSGVWFLLFEDGALIAGLVALCITVIGFLCRRYAIWKRTTFTITSERILIHLYETTLRDATHTIAWRTFQESEYTGGLWDHLFNTGAVAIHYGTEAAQRVVSIRPIPYALDLKHYLDKINALVRQHVPASELPAFVPAKKGKRDTAVLSYIE